VRLLGLGYVLRFEHLHASGISYNGAALYFFSHKLGSSLRGVFASLATLWDAPQRANVGLPSSDLHAFLMFRR